MPRGRLSKYPQFPLISAAGSSEKHVPRAPLNTEFNSVLKYGLKMRLAPKFTPIYLNLGVLREFVN